MKIAVIGAGSWGTALSMLAANNGHDVNLWCRRESVANELNNLRENKQYLPGVVLPQSVLASGDIKKCLEGVEIIIICVPSEFLRSTLLQIVPCLGDQIVVSAVKGIEYKSCKTSSQLVEEVFYQNKVKVAVLSGPTHAGEVSRGLPTACVVASKSNPVAQLIADCLGGKVFKTYISGDVVGVEICGALKNITAVAGGVCDGFNLGDNAKASIIVMGLMEMNNFGRRFGAKRSTVYGLAGVGDLVATCMSKHSRNRFLGECIAKGFKMDEVKNLMKGMVAEGVPTTKAVYEYSIENRISMPLTEQAYGVLYGGKDAKTAFKDLLRLL